jgi:hypothetical protein
MKVIREIISIQTLRISILLHSFMTVMIGAPRRLIYSHSSAILFVIGVLLISGGTLDIAFSQKDPVPANPKDPDTATPQDPTRLDAQDPTALFDQNPQGIINFGIPEQVFNLGIPEQVFNFGIPEQIANFNPEVAVGVLPEQPAIPAADPEPLEANYDDSLVRFSVGNLLRFIEGSFGALVMVASGIGAIVAAAFGAYKAAIALLFVAVGAFILRSLVSLFFGTNYEAYSADGIEFVGGGL